MSIELKMPALSPTMEEGTLAKWLVKEGDTVASGDILAEIETDKATMEFEAVDEGKIAKILIPEGSDGVKVGTPIAILAGEGEEVSAAPPPKVETAPPPKIEEPKVEPAPPAKGGGETPAAAPAPAAPAPKVDSGDRIKASPLARRLAEAQGIDLKTLKGSGPGGRIVRADLGTAAGGAMAATVPQAATLVPA
ncbi:MAG TPA: biotin/lipoyl-containing protein, partial [Sphingomicrobium sp.]|nr:biotin/lipoyl-containing protein [Sphingomicrobium sp.]